MTAPRKPAAFRIEPEAEAAPQPPRSRVDEEQRARRPRAARADVAVVKARVAIRAARTNFRISNSRTF